MPSSSSFLHYLFCIMHCSLFSLLMHFHSQLFYINVLYQQHFVFNILHLRTHLLEHLSFGEVQIRWIQKKKLRMTFAPLPPALVSGKYVANLSKICVNLRKFATEFILLWRNRRLLWWFCILCSVFCIFFVFPLKLKIMMTTLNHIQRRHSMQME